MVDLHYDGSTLSFSIVNAVYFHKLGFEPILPFQQCAFDYLTEVERSSAAGG